MLLWTLRTKNPHLNKPVGPNEGFELEKGSGLDLGKTWPNLFNRFSYDTLHHIPLWRITSEKYIG